MNMNIRDFVRRLGWWFTYLGPRRDITINTFNGLLSFDSKDWLIGKYLYVRRSYEAAEMQRAIALLRDEGYISENNRGTVLDVGANIGMTCIALLKLGYFNRAIAFEPAPNSYRLLSRNVLQNAFTDKIVHFPWAISSAQGEAELEISHDNSGNNRLRRTKQAGAFKEERRRTVTVKVRTLDDVMATEPALRAEKISVIWLDVEGHEGHFFLGAQKLLEQPIPVVTEFWPYAVSRSGMSRREFCDILTRLFTHFYVLTSHTCEKQPIYQFDDLFDVYKRPREMCQVILIAAPSQI
jgi:FkbM family methyltransferase